MPCYASFEKSKKIKLTLNLNLTNNRQRYTHFEKKKKKKLFVIDEQLIRNTKHEMGAHQQYF